MTTPPPPPSRRRAVYIALPVLALLSLFVLLGLRPSKSDKITMPTLTQTQEIALGVAAAPALASAHGGLSTDAAASANVARVGQHIVTASDAARLGWKFEFHLLAEPIYIDAYALPGGQIFITTAMLNRMQTEGELAAVLAQQIAHVSARDVAHSLKAQGLTNVLNTGGQLSDLVPETVRFTFTPEQELAADSKAIDYMSQAGYSPNAMLGLLRILSKAYYDKADVSYFTTHPNASNRVQNINDTIARLYPTGIPANLSQ